MAGKKIGISTIRIDRREDSEKAVQSTSTARCREKGT
jgi:hypothetical protein